MIITQLKIKNFRGYGVNQDNEQGFYVFDNLDSNFVLLSGFNGFGKTSFFEAIEWCLTDKIRRLEKFEENYYVPDLKKAQYLKFHNSKNNGDRKIEVEITFDNGYRISRTSYSSAHFAGNGDNYLSELKIFQYDKEVDESSSNTSILQMLIPDVDDLLEKIEGMNDRKEIRQLESKYADTFLNTNMLTQENLSFFLRSTDPIERRSMFMKLLNLTEIDSLYERVTSMRRGRGFSSKKGEINEKLNQISRFLDGIDSFFKLKELGSINNYLSTINNKHKMLTDFIKEKALDKEHVFTADPITLNNYAEVMIKVDNEKKKINSRIDNHQKNKIDLNLIKEDINKLALLKTGMDLQNKLEQSSLLIEFDYSELLSKENEINKMIDDNIRNRVAISHKSKNLSTFKYDFTSLFITLDEKGGRIKGDFWDLLIHFKDLYVKFRIFTEQNVPIEYLIEESQIQGLTNILKLKEEYDSLVKKYEQTENYLSKVETDYNIRSTLNDQNVEMLKQVREYLVGNTEISECPVCLNSKFENKENSVPTAYHIISIINNSISQGNENLEKLSNQMTDFMEIKNKTYNSIREKITYIQEELQKIEREYKAKYVKIHDYFSNLLNSIELIEGGLREQLSIIFENKKRFEECYKVIFNTDTIPNEINKQIIINSLEKINKQKDEWYMQNKEILNFSIVPKKQEIDEKIIYYKSKKNLEKYYPEKVESLQVDIENVDNKLEVYTELVSYLQVLEELKLDDTYLLKIQQYNQQIKDKENYESTLDQIESYEKTLKKLFENLTSIQQSAVQKQLSNHPIITWIYESINPHPFYNKLVISTGDGGTNFKNEDSSVNLDQIFSSAQLNILALSVFLGLGISQDYSNIKQLFLDDPIQSMDDVNVLAFIDVLRAVLDSNSKQKKIIISTHDDNFAKLLSIKMRNRSFVEYKFNSYGDEGPFIEKIINY